ncbi:histidine kinase [Burkholderia paludis]|uniref:ATP-binding response regulator n=1 Tax=Burkholderia paludis TaxID=1506587 RepID=UPI0005BCCCC0|nr:ATP-binding protein [Burkholderia paludis]KFG98076.1 histidine kinase [Burkholderia paludis]
MNTTIQFRDKISAEQLKIVYGIVDLSVIGATLLAIVLVVSLHRLGQLDPVIGASWLLYIGTCSGGHILLSRFYRKSGSFVSRRSFWAAWFVALSLAEGIGWGWSSVQLVTGSNFEIRYLAVIATLGVVAGSVPVFSAYLPAFVAFLLPATLPYVIVTALSENRVQQVTAPMMSLFVCVIGYLGILGNRTATQNIRLRFDAEKLAVDLQAQNDVVLKLADDLRKQKQIAEEASLAKSRFLAAASHDLRQPSHALSLLVGALSSIPMNADGKSIVEQIEISTLALDRLFATLLDISKLDAGVVEVQYQSFAIDAILARICRDYASDAAEKGITLSHVPTRAVVYSDPILVERIVRNLVSNAVRYTDAGKIAVGCRLRGVHVAIQVWDTGRGIPHDLLDLVFQEYYQIENPERDREKGLGLGLAIVRRLADLLGSKLAVQSEPGRGSCFEIVIELSDGMAVPIELPVAERLDTSSATGLVVIVDDEQPIRDAMSKLLTIWGYEVVAAGSGDEIIASLSTCAKRPDLLVCDFRLRGDENGITVIERVRMEYNEDIPAMLISGDTAADRLADAHENGMILLHKPISHDKLRASIGNLIATG